MRKRLRKKLRKKAHQEWLSYLKKDAELLDKLEYELLQVMASKKENQQ